MITNPIIYLISFFIALNLSIHLKKNYQNQRSFPNITEGLVNWLNKSGIKDESGSYKHKDHSGIILIIGKRRSGKGVTSYSIIKQILKSDSGRVLNLWKAPPQIVPYLKKHGIKCKNVEEFKDLDYNAIWFIDEGILNVNAKKALTKFARSMDEIISIISHKRIIMIITFQRWQVFTSLVEQSDCIIYKNLGERMINRSRNDAFLKKHAKLINSLPKQFALVESDLDGFSATGLIKVSMPSWYSSILSESYKDVNLDFELNEDKKRNVRLEEIAMEMLNEGYIPSVKDKQRTESIKSIIENKYQNDKLKSTEIGKIIRKMYRILSYEKERIDNEDEEKESENKDNENKEKDSDSENRSLEDINLNVDLKQFGNFQSTITEFDLDIANQFAQGRASTDFLDYKGGVTGKKVMIIVRKVIQYLLFSFYKKSKADKLGNEYERLIANHYIIKKGDYCIRALASGGKRGLSIQPDMIHFLKDGRIRIVQIKVRKESQFTFKPFTFETELNISELLQSFHTLKKKVTTWLYFMKKGNNYDKIMEIEITESNNEEYLYIDFDKQFFEFRKEKDSIKILDSTSKKKSSKISKKVSEKKSSNDVKKIQNDNDKLKKIDSENKVKIDKKNDKIKVI